MPASHTVRVNLDDRSYDVLIGHGLLKEVGALAAKLLGRTKCAIVTESTVGPLYAQAVQESLTAAGISTHVVAVPAGEASKSMDVVENVCREMLQFGLDRKSFLVALGGGVIGDLAGFAASIF